MEEIKWPKAVIFDVDGVLVDSLGKHLEFCREMAAKRDLNISIPTEDAFRSMVSSGTKVSPMRNFFVALKFPPVFLDRLDKDYEKKV